MSGLARDELIDSLEQDAGAKYLRRCPLLFVLKSPPRGWSPTLG